jgi:hypothetical protein
VLWGIGKVLDLRQSFPALAGGENRATSLIKIGRNWLCPVDFLCITKALMRFDRSIDPMQMSRRAHKPKASCAVDSDHDQIPVARFSPPARAGITSRKRRICRSDHRKASICSTSVRAERFAYISVEK